MNRFSCLLYDGNRFLNSLSEVIFRLKHATLLKVTLRYGCLSRLLNSTHGTKSANAIQIICQPCKNHTLDYEKIQKERKTK